MKRRRTAQAPWQLDVESSVRDQLYGERAELEVTPIRDGTLARVGGRYRLLEPLGTGRTAEVFRARDERLRRDVAVKVIAEALAHDPAAVRRFQREAELCARLAHRNVAAVFDAGSRPREYIVMELVSGPDLATPSVGALLQLCDALEHAHGRGVVHGDVMPRNVLVGRDGTAKLIDFGHATEGFETDADVEALAVIASRLLPVDAGRPASLAELRRRLPASHDAARLRAA
jgi:serine/threonine protein kinase